MTGAYVTTAQPPREGVREEGGEREREGGMSLEERKCVRVCEGRGGMPREFVWE